MIVADDLACDLELPPGGVDRALRGRQPRAMTVALDDPTCELLGLVIVDRAIGDDAHEVTP